MGDVLQRYVEQLRRCLLLEASEQSAASASLGVVKLANEIVSSLPHYSVHDIWVCIVASL